MRSQLLSNPRRITAPWQRNYRIDAVTAGLSGVYVGVLGPYLGLVAAKRFHAEGPMMSLMMVAPFVGNMLTPFWAHRMHGRPKLPWVTIPAVAARLLYLLMYAVQTAPQFVAVVFISQALEASVGPAYCAVMESIYPGTRRGRLMSTVRVFRTIIAIIIAVIAGHVLDTWGFRKIFVAAAMFGVGASTVFSTLRVPAEQHEQEQAGPSTSPKEPWRIFRTDRAYRRYSISIFIYGTGNLILAPLYPLFLVHTLHITYAQQGVLAFSGMAAMAVGFGFWGHVVDRWGPIRCVYACIAVVILRPLIFYFAPDFHWLVPAAVLGGITDAGIEIGYLSVILSFSPPALVPSYQSLHSTLLGLRGVLSMFLAAVIGSALQSHHRGYGPAFLLSAMMIFAGFCLGRGVKEKGQ